VNEALKGKVFIIGTDQVSRYDDILKALLGYLSSNHNHRVRSRIEHKNKNIVVKLITKQTTPKKDGPNDSSKPKILDQDGEVWVIYQIKLKKYINRITKIEDDLQQIYNIIIGQCSPGTEQALSSIKGFQNIKKEAESIKLLKVIEQVCYNYQPHEYPPLGTREALDKLGKAIPPATVLESNHYESIKTIVEVYKASGVNFAMLCTHIVDMAMTSLVKERSITVSSTGKFKNGDYFTLSNDHRDLVNEKAEEICIATRLLHLSSNKKLFASKKELCNDLVKGKDNYPRTVAGVMKFL